MIGDYENDAHFCLKCHSTIIGLDNYVSHRKTGCTKNLEPSKSPLPSQLLPPDESFNLKADDFFSSLELQSSSKKPNTQSTSGKNFSGILTRSKTGVIPPSTSNKREEIPQSKSGKNVWIGGHQLKELGHGDNESKLIKAVANLERRKPEEDVRLEVYEESDEESEEYESDVDESSDDEDAPPRNHTGGKWKPSSPIQWNRQQQHSTTENWNVPPSSFTGGKWKRNFSPPPTHTKGKWKPSYNPSPSKENYDVPPPSFTGSKWTPAKAARQDLDIVLPPPIHTKCKWKPVRNEIVEVPNAPPAEHTKGKWIPSSEDASLKPNKSEIMSPNYTKGKWKPGNESFVGKKSSANKKEATVAKIIDDSPFRKSGGTVQYWCRPCNRHLASKVVYERHLKSELHFKRTLHDKEIDDVVGINLLKDGRRIKKKLPDIVFHDEEKQRKLLENKKRIRQKIYIHCKVCKSKVNRNLIAKHLYSHYHCKNSDLRNEDTKKMILDNIYSVVLQSPFQCNTCKYYYNNESDFLKHWESENHIKNQADKPGYFSCSLCKFEAETNELMYDHLTSKTHKDVVAVINYSVPIIIKKINPIVCKICNENFLLNIQFLKHCKAKNHDLTKIGYNSNYICEKCNHAFQSKIALSRHKRTAHSEQVFVCSICDKNFKNLVEAKVHRRTKEHRYNLLSKKNHTERKCMYCHNTFENFAKLKHHLRNEHVEHHPKCPHCNMSFIVPQELTVHIRTKSCTLATQKNTKTNKENSCYKCSYSSDSQSELLFHKALHSEPLIVFPEQGKPIHQYKCLICEKFFAKASLQGHLRVHTKERPFVCTICNAGFVRKNNLLFHVKNHGKRDSKKEKRKEIVGVYGERPFLCSTCGKSFQKRSILQQHMIIHTGKSIKCLKDGCFYSARSMGELEQHFLAHSDEKTIKCDLCEYTGKTKQQLKRHMTTHDSEKKYQCPQCNFSTRLSSHLKRHSRLHTGAKPFICPHCDYKCNSLENLRKHILSTNKHPGKCIYECKFCSEDCERFKTNFSKEFKAHLLTQHLNTFKDASAATSYIAGIYHPHDDATNTPSVDLEDDRMSNACVIILQEHSTGDIKRLKTNSDPVVTGSSSRQSIHQPSTSKLVYMETNRNEEEMFTTYTVLKDDGIDNPSDSWNLVGSYDVEESGTLVNFQNDEENYFIDFE